MKIKGEFIFPCALKEEPIFCNICKQFNIVLSIIEASFSTDTGWAILVIEGEEEDLNKTFEYLKSKGVEMKDLQI
jgi:ABC-type methionine transport system ATPase subunit